MFALKTVAVLVVFTTADSIRLANSSTSATHLTKSLANSTVNATHKKKEHNWTAQEQLEHLSASLKAIQNLQAMFTSPDTQAVMGFSEASGAMTSELSKKDSSVWATIANMVHASQKAMTEMKGKSKTEADKLMQNLETEMNSKAVDLKNVSDRATEVNNQHSAEYVLGLFNMHQKDWSIAKQLNVTQEFANGSFQVWQLAHKHDMSRPFAPQLAAIMDEAKQALVDSKNATKKALLKNGTKTTKSNATIAKTAATKANATIAKTAVVKATAAEKAAVTKKAAKQFIQLVSSLREMRA